MGAPTLGNPHEPRNPNEPNNELYVKCNDCGYVDLCNYSKRNLFSDDVHNYDVVFTRALAHAKFQKHCVEVYYLSNEVPLAFHELDFRKKTLSQKLYPYKNYVGIIFIVWAILSIVFLKPSGIVYWANIFTICCWLFIFTFDLLTADWFLRFSKSVVNFFRKGN